MGLPNSKRQDALADLVNRLSFIQKEKGYNTDVGLHQIFKGELPRGGEGDPDEALAITVGDDSPEPAGGKTRTRVPFEIHAIVKIGTEDPLVTVEAIIADIKEAVEIEADGSIDRFLGAAVGSPPEPHGTLPRGLERGVTRALRREEGSEYVGAVVEYMASFEETWGAGGS